VSLPPLVLAVALQAAAAAAPPPAWRQLGAHEGIEVAIDAASVQAEGGRVRVRVRATLPAPGPDGIASVTGTTEIDCAAGTATALDAKGYDAQGRLMFNGVVPMAQRQAEPIRPGSAKAAVRAAVCADRAR
jgi:hypothetical protein